MVRAVASAALRARAVIFLACVALAGVAVNPMVLRSTENPANVPTQGNGNAALTAGAPASGGPFRLENKSYPPGRTLLVGKAGQVLEEPVRFLVTDTAGVPVAGVSVVLEIVSRPKGAEDAEIASPVVSDSAGFVSANLSLGKAPGDYVISARVASMAGEMPHVSAHALKGNWWLMVVMGIVGGLGMFLFGMELGAGGLQKVAGNKMRDILAKLTTNRVMAVVAGAIITAVVQSSTATTVMVVGFVNVALMNLTQAIGVIMGANIGTTLTVQLIAFKISDYALLMMGIGVLLTLVTKRKVYIYTGEIFLGFGMIFYGMAIMSSSVAPLRIQPWFNELMLYLAHAPLLGLFVATILSAIMHSGATIGLAVVLASEGLMTMDAAMPIILGANIGTTVTTVIASLGTDTEGRRAALAHMLFNVLGTAIVFPILTYWNQWMRAVTLAMGSNSVAREVANGTMFFNVGATCAFLPFLPWFRKAVEWLVPSKETKEKAFGAKYLNNDLLETPDLALTAAYQEINRTADIVGEMHQYAMEAFGKDGEAVREKLATHCSEVETLHGQFQSYYIRLAQKNLGLMQSREKQGHVTIMDDLRQISNFLGVDVVNTSARLAQVGAKFSDEGARELRQFHAFTVDLHRQTAQAIRERDRALATAVRGRKDEGEELERRLRDSHLARLDAGLQESAATSSAHMDMLTGIRQMGRHYFRICGALERFLTPPS